MIINEDDRRILLDLSDDMDIKSTKIITAKEECVLGNHYHKIKTERFFLIQGECAIVRKSPGEDWERTPMILNKPYIVKPFVRHYLWPERGAILVCLVDKEYDKNDDYTD